MFGIADAAANGAVIAALGYVGKILWEKIDAELTRRAARETSLVQLQSFLLASKTVFNAQASIRDRLYRELTASHHSPTKPYDDFLAAAFPNMSDSQKLQHGLIRSYTVNAMYPANVSMLEWLEKDTFYKKQENPLGLALRQLDAHLVVWCAKYKFWINRPERALVYLDDEWKHGIGFPKGLDELVLAETKSQSLTRDEPSQV